MPSEALATVEWRTLTTLSRRETFLELVLPLPWLTISLLFAVTDWWPLALPASFVFFNAGLRVVHGAYHRTIGLSSAACHAVMFVLSILMLGSMHAVRHNHLVHHRHCHGDDDIEGSCARRSLLGAILYGPVFPLRMHWHALRRGTPHERVWIVVELFANAALITVAFGVTVFPESAHAALRYHVCAMLAGQCLAAFFCVWTVHHDCPSEGAIARTIRDRVGSFMTLAMFYHVEHHLFPAVPTAHLPQLARRIDAVAPDLTRLRVYERNAAQSTSEAPVTNPLAPSAGH
ncbi:MAG: fatty acid desaturase family protein [Phycisphaerae bacterium]